MGTCCQFVITRSPCDRGICFCFSLTRDIRPLPPPCKFAIFIALHGFPRKMAQLKELQVKILRNKELGGWFRSVERSWKGKSEARRQRTGPFTGQSSQLKSSIEG